MEQEPQNEKKESSSIDLGDEAKKELQDLLSGSENDETRQGNSERVEFERDQTYDQQGHSSDPRVFDSPALTIADQDISVTDSEKEIFLESVLHDRPFKLDIEVGKNSLIRVRSRNVYEQSLCYECVRQMSNNPDNEKNLDVLLWLQRFNVALSVCKIGEENFGSLEFHGPEDGFRQDDIDTLKKWVGENLVNISYPRWQMILRALMVFTAKEKLLLENIANRDFWNPAD